MRFLNQQDAKIRLEKSKTNNGNGVTWACEIGDQTMVCPLIVEDLSTPGQMLIEVSNRFFITYHTYNYFDES